MAIEDTLERIAVALEKIAATGGTLAAQPAATAATTKPAAAKAEDKKPESKAEEKKPEPKADGPGPDIEAVRKALQDFRALEGTASMLEVLKEFGAENLAGIKPADYAAIVKRVS